MVEFEHHIHYSVHWRKDARCPQRDNVVGEGKCGGHQGLRSEILYCLSLIRIWDEDDIIARRVLIDDCGVGDVDRWVRRINAHCGRDSRLVYQESENKEGNWNYKCFGIIIVPNG
jgi:hypothetical protein